MVAPLVAASIGMSALNMLSNAAEKTLTQPGAGIKNPTMTNAKAIKAAQEFEAVFMNTMIQQMFTGTDGEGPMGGQGAGGVWRSFLTDEYAKTFSKAGGIGIAQHVYSSLLAQQEIQK